MLARAHLTRRRTQNTLTILGIAVGVMVLIAALSLRHDARVADGPASGPAREA